MKETQPNNADRKESSVDPYQTGLQQLLAL